MKDKSGKLCWLMLAAMALLSAGCGGFGGTYQASPASLLLMKNDAKPAVKTVPVTAPLPVSLLTVD
ncbi:MAG TPA: hypothetical protein VMB21_07820 [Candidatus Limnocylindria bacterium]|jgi:hypothetical protein|nr:hypothetical protein [Candidatus Limnocylindria bacterium]